MDPAAGIRQVDRIVELIEDLDEEIKDKAPDFFEGVMKTAKSIGETIEESGVVTLKQQKALDNMEASVERWQGRGR